MKIDIKQEYGHYVMYVNGKFYGSYDSFKEAMDDADILTVEKESA